MSTSLDILRAILLGVPAVVLLFLASTVFFDVVHWILHGMLSSRFGILRALARPHGVHHAWIDRELRVNWEYQGANVWCHLVLEYVSQLAFTAALALVLPRGLLLGLVAMQTLVFLLLLREEGLDLNHRPQPVVEVARPSVFCPVAYHALHHAYPNAFFSSYVKIVDGFLGTAIHLPSLRIGLVGSRSAFGRALRGALRAAGACDVVDVEAAGERADIDVLVLCEPVNDLEASVEAYLATNGSRQLPGEVWAVLASPADSTARHYYGDRRLRFRPIVLPRGAQGDEAVMSRAARKSLWWIRRGAHLPRTSRRSSTAGAFLRVPPVRPPGSQRSAGGRSISRRRRLRRSGLLRFGRTAALGARACLGASRGGGFLPGGLLAALCPVQLGAERIDARRDGVQALGEIGDAALHHADLSFQLILVALQAVALGVHDPPQSADETHEGLQLVGGSLEVVGRRTDPVTELADAFLEAPNPLCEQISGLTTWGRRRHRS